ncbi:MAG: DPP IV N-terminal domain-containing protein [Anaerolineae bacterium]|nr:DPP IV N-terminal domain-containing protein [Gloeobacterales cyanobacterium ES-bin-313]
MRIIPVILSACLAGILCAGISCAAPIDSSQPVATVDTKFLTDFAVTRGFTLGRPTKPRFTPDSKSILFLRSEPRSVLLRLYEFDLATKTTRVLLTPEQILKGADEKLSPEEAARRERMRISTRGFSSFEISPDGSQVLVSLSGKLYVLSRKEGTFRQLATSAGTLLDPKFTPDGRSIAYVLDSDLYRFDLVSFKEQRVTTGGTEDISHAQAEFVAQEEMGRLSGYWWSPDAKQVAYQQTDARDVETWAPADPAKPEQLPYSQRYPRPGKHNVKVRLGVTSATGGETNWISWDHERYPYLATVKWEKSSPLTLLVQDRKQKEMVLLTADPETGKTRELLRETDSAWLNLDQDMPSWLPDGSGFLWTSEREGARQLELRDKSGSLVRVLVPGSFGYIPESDIPNRIDATGKQVYFRASTDPTQSQLYRIALSGGEPEALSTGFGLHSAVYSFDHTLAVEGMITPKALNRWAVRKMEGTVLGELPSVSEEPPFIPNTEFVQVGDYYCSIVRPTNFDPKQRYPVIDYVYGGPGAQQVTASMGSQLRAQWWADQGFIVVAIDGRGTPRRNRAWERAIKNSFGTIPLQDQVDALTALGKRYPELDLGRVGITGWSFGGYMSALAVLRRPDFFKAAVAGAPVVDWLDYDTHYTERYLGLPEENPLGYKESSLLTYADNLQRPLLLVHGTSDDNVFFLHTLKLTDQLFRAGKNYELLTLSGFTHMVYDPQIRERLEERLVRFFRENL